MKLCVSTGISAMLPDKTPLPFRESVDLAKAVGFEEFDLGLYSRNVIKEDWQAELDSMLDTINAAGMSVKYVHIPFDYPRTDDAEDWAKFSEATIKSIDAVRYAGADCAAIHPRSYMTPRYDADKEYSDAVEFLTPFCEHAHKIGVHLAIENMRGPGASGPARIRRFGTDTDVLIRLADELDEGICWDTGHANISLQDQYKSIKKVGNRLLMVHINDNFAEDDVHIAPFIGNVNWNEVITALREVGYAGSMNLEVKCNRFPPELRRLYAEFMAASGRYLIKKFDEK